MIMRSSGWLAGWLKEFWSSGWADGERLWGVQMGKGESLRSLARSAERPGIFYEENA